MNKEQVLSMSRNENKGQDVYEKEVMRAAGNIGAITAALLATIFFFVQVILGEGVNYSLYAIVFAIEAASFTYKAFKLERKHEIFVAACYIIITLLFSAAHIWQLITNCTMM